METQFKCALVTGASSGIGEAVARLLASKGIALIITGRNRDRLEKLAAEFERRVNVEIVVADLSRPIERAIVTAMIREKVPDLLVNNAGSGLYGDIIEHTNEMELEIVRLDVEAVVELTMEAARALAAAKRQGVILNVSSVSPYFIFPKFAVYSASKAFINQFTQSTDWELKAKGIRVLAACPGFVSTRFRERAGGKTSKKEMKQAMTTEYAAEQIWWQIQKGRPIHIFSFQYRILAFLATYLMPKSWVAKINSKIMRQLSL